MSFNTDFDAFLNAADAEFSGVAVKAKADQQRFPCQSCAGTGRYQGRRTVQEKAHCFDCKGKGYFLTDARTRAKSRLAAVKRRESAKDVARAFNVEHFGETLTALQAVASWNDFARSLLVQHDEGKQISEKAIAAARSMLAKIEAKRAEKAAAVKAATVEVDLSPIREMFDTAIASGYKKPIYRALGLRLKPGKDNSIYVLTEARVEYGAFGEQPGYEGKIATGKFQPVRACAPDTADKLRAIAADPKGEAIRYGQLTGTCSCCGRELTKHASIEAGIGPICAEKWGF